ncbi:hypothetical protein A4X09_0g7709 [Tilletia walkeri]|uniref:Uncharacterized protein n=1 Tax=Tilletia walkeri TaxID=117179 RepID=A0A8X7T1D5_9BASI|nr:hypothetical protein A4X09_0g7709 [Tilletia walkeri]
MANYGSLRGRGILFASSSKRIVSMPQGYHGNIRTSRCPSTPSPTTRSPTIPSAMAFHIWTVLATRLRENNILFSPALLSDQHRFLDSISTHPQAVGIWTALLDQPLRVPDQDINKVLQLDAARTSDLPANDGIHGFYLRSFPIKVGQA